MRFAVEEVFELAQRGTTVAVGRLDGVVSAGMTLRDEQTGEPVTIAAVELMRPNDGRVGLVIDPASPTRPTRGMVLVSPVR